MGKFVLPLVLPQNLFGLKTTQESGNPNINQIQNTISLIKKFSEKKKKTLIVLWPSEDELLNEESREFYYTMKNELKQIKSNKIDFIDIIELGVINPKFYKDGIHPNPIGVSVLSEIISANLQSR
jgi:lysophospholipase L1-like esterase